MTEVLGKNDEMNDNGCKESHSETFYEPSNRVAPRFPHGEPQEQLILSYSK